MKTYFAIGLMSGTSLDGLDICYAKFQNITNWEFEILKTETIPYSIEWKNRLQNAILLSAEDLLALDKEYGFYLGEKTQEFISKNNIADLDFIASHGHTVFHQPQRKFTLQIGDGRAIKLTTKKPVIYDFRSQDVLMGGNGAPLVPIGDELLFSQYDACLNLGGFSNISLQKNHQRIAFDISPVNVVLNYFAGKLGKNYDENGDFARNGAINFKILEELNALTFYQKPAPKSLGVEFVNSEIFPLLKDETPENIIATFTEHIAEQIAKVFNDNQLKTVLVTGGGTFNTYLLEKIQEKSHTELIVPDENIINFKEALIFAFMGVLRIRNEVNVLCSATGSSENHCSGILV
ncbi:anhydro-N-acetylmuramic acid kinase [Cloacibacterium caeni]|uniref:anhydro-N-acetylmuramic acid kinase n=1 Tax=Cloacibacterium caeni TaxID=2004710 RepID=UPI001BD054C6|nr:anhydro-N-acetylmuramic acid kinase [Cloacibacterium caeni]